MTVYVMMLANKRKYLRDAIRSVRAQTRTDFIHVVALDNGQDWGGYPPAVWFNREAKEISPENYIAWLSDDDVLLPNYVADLAGYLDAHPEVDCCYGGSEVVLEDGQGTRSPWTWLPDYPDRLNAKRWPVFDTKNLPGCVIDGGQIMLRRSALSAIAQPWMPIATEPTTARLTDASLLNKLANAVGIYPVPVQVMINRITPLSAHCRPGPGGQRVITDWRRAPKW